MPLGHESPAGEYNVKYVRRYYMSYHSFSLIPAFSNNPLSDRFSRIDNLFSRLTGNEPLSDNPSYNLLQRDETHYELTVSIPGYQEHELDISVLNSQLTISGKQSAATEHQEKEKWLHKGINQREFSLQFGLGHRVKVRNASLSLGLLKVEIEDEIPEQEKPQKISISSNNDSHRTIEHNK